MTIIERRWWLAWWWRWWGPALPILLVVVLLVAASLLSCDAGPGVATTPDQCRAMCQPGGVWEISATRCLCAAPEACSVDRLLVTPVPPGKRVAARP